MVDIKELIAQQIEEMRISTHDIVRGFFDTGISYDFHEEWKPYYSVDNISFNDPLFPEVDFYNVNELIREAIGKVTKKTIVSVLINCGYKVIYQEKEHLVRFKKRRDDFYIWFSSFNKIYLNENKEFRFLEKDVESKTPVARIVCRDAVLCCINAFNFDEKIKKNTTIVLSSIVSDLKPNTKTLEYLEGFAGIETAISFLKRYLSFEEQEMLKPLGDIPSIIKKEVTRAASYFHLNGIRVVRNYDIQMPSPVKLSEDFSDVSFDDLNLIINSFLNGVIEKEKKPKWVVAYETAEWMWAKFHTIKYFDNLFISSEYFKAFDMFFSYFFEEKLFIYSKATLGDKFMSLKNNHNDINPNRIANNKNFRRKYFALFADYLDKRNRYIHQDYLANIDLVKYAREKTIDLIRMTIFAFHDVGDNKHEES